MPYTIVVLIKQVPDMNTVRIDKASGRPLLSGQLAISSYDDYAIEAALRIKEAHEGEIIAISAGPASVKDALTRALAMGADRAIQIPLDQNNGLETLEVARILADQIKGLNADIVLAGQNSDDNASGQVGPQVAELLGIPSLGSIAQLTLDGPKAIVARDTEDGRQTIEVQTPVMIMAQAGLNEPRYPSLKGIMAAKKKPLDNVEAAPSSGAKRISWGEPTVPERGNKGVMVQDAAPADAAKQLVSWLREHKLV